MQWGQENSPEVLLGSRYSLTSPRRCLFSRHFSFCIDIEESHKFAEILYLLQNPTAARSLVSSGLFEPHSPCVRHLAVFAEQWPCLSERKASERCCVFILLRWCTATTIQLPSPKQLWLTKQPLTCLAVHAGVVSLRPHRRCCAPLTLAFKSANGLCVASTRRPSIFLHTAQYDNLLDPPSEAAAPSTIVGLWGVFCCPALAVQLLAESSWTLQISQRVQR